MSEAIVRSPSVELETRIHEIRGRRVMLDADLAAAYGVETRVLVQAVKRNSSRFPGDFMLRMTVEEASRLRSQTVISNVGRGGRRSLPYAFTEHGAVMLASVLNSPVAVRASVEVVRAFLRLRQVAQQSADLARRIDEVESRFDRRFRAVFRELRLLALPPDDPPHRCVGFRPAAPGAAGSARRRGR